jgi:predicted outer membrane protein
MKTSIICAAVAMVTLASTAMAADDLASKVIQSEPIGAYNPTNNSEEELNKAAAFNSGIRLQYIILHETNEELKICFALRILESQIAAARRLASDTSDDGRAKRYLAGLQDTQTKLAKQLRAIQDKKAKSPAPANRSYLNQPQKSAALDTLPVDC